MFKQVAITELKPGMMVSRVLQQSGPVKIRKVGMIRSVDMVKGLKEMGVTEVEIDLAQSIETSADDPATINDNTDVTLASTATQKLLASERQVANVDRQLSQQFHRSLFLPAVDDTTPKLGIYSRPYLIVAILALFGVMIGWGATYSVLTFSIEKQPDTILSDVNSNAQNIDEALNENSENAELASNDDRSAPEVDSEINDEIETGKNLTATEQVMQTPIPEAAETVTDSEQGVILEEGQIVLGFRPDDELNDSNNEEPLQILSNTSPNTSVESEPNVNPDLLRRIQEAADLVDNRSENNFEPPSVLNVTDLNDLPRIDQLSPSMLTRMPAMSFSAHMYASNPQDRWVRVNGRRLGEGDFIENNLMIKQIESEKVVLSFMDTEFTMNALSDW